MYLHLTNLEFIFMLLIIYVLNMDSTKHANLSAYSVVMTAPKTIHDILPQNTGIPFDLGLAVN